MLEWVEREGGGIRSPHLCTSHLLPCSTPSTHNADTSMDNRVYILCVSLSSMHCSLTTHACTQSMYVCLASIVIDDDRK